jgi:hypothetical protein
VFAFAYRTHLNSTDSNLTEELSLSSKRQQVDRPYVDLMCEAHQNVCVQIGCPQHAVIRRLNVISVRRYQATMSGASAPTFLAFFT